MVMGRRSKYNPDTFPLLAEGYAREGMIDKDIARKLGIHVATFYKYELKYNEFNDAIRKGKAPVNFIAENSMLKRVTGYSYEEVTKVMVLDADNNPVLKEIRTTKKEVIPSVPAGEFWLKNRMPDKWRDKHEVEHSGEIKGDKAIKISYSDLNDD